jgi:hypothetical protein
MQSNPDFPWKLSQVSFNPNITFENVIKNQLPHVTKKPGIPNECTWHLRYLSKNKFNKHPVVAKRIEKRIQHRKNCYNIFINTMDSNIAYEIAMYM